MLIYLFDNDGFYKGKKQVEDDYELGLYETTIAPTFTPNNRSDFDGTEWHDYSEAAYMHEVPAPTNEKRVIPPSPAAVQPTQEQRMIAKLGADVAQTQAMIAKIATMIKPQGGQSNE